MKKSLFEQRSERRCKAIKGLVDNNEWSVAYALEKLEELFDDEKVTEADYTNLAEYLEALLEQPVTEPIEEPVEEEPEGIEESNESEW